MLRHAPDHFVSAAHDFLFIVIVALGFRHVSASI
jgi:hypothetical protein